MKINADFDQRVLIHSAEMDWIASPMAGVERRPLDRVGGEVARATSIVRYAPGSHFSPHTHSGGEEFIVLDGVFQDQHGDYPVGSYVRNPPQSRHRPGSEPGCVIFVKLWQFAPEDRLHVRLQMQAMGGVEPANAPGILETPLYQDEAETVRLVTCAPNSQFDLDARNGAEILVLEGDVAEAGDKLLVQSWLRLPIGTSTRLSAGGAGARLWLKTGHLPHVSAQISRVEAQS